MKDIEQTRKWSAVQCPFLFIKEIEKKEKKNNGKAAGVIDLFLLLRQQDQLNEVKARQIDWALNRILDFIERRIIELKYFTSEETKDINICLKLGVRKESRLLITSRRGIFYCQCFGQFLITWLKFFGFTLTVPYSFFVGLKTKSLKCQLPVLLSYPAS